MEKRLSGLEINEDTYSKDITVILWNGRKVPWYIRLREQKVVVGL